MAEMPICRVHQIEYLPVASLKTSSRNARTHSDKQVGQIAKSIRRFGFTNSILIDDENNILAGHGRALGAVAAGLVNVPCVRLAGMSEEEKRAYLIADNQLAIKAGWDNELLAIELRELGDLEFDLSALGFEIGEIDLIIEGADQADPTTNVDRDDEFVPPDKLATAVTRVGDLWNLGRHRVLCGNARNEGHVITLMGGHQADVLLTDPPYNTPINGHVSGLGRIRHREFAEASGEMSSLEYTNFLRETLSLASGRCRDGAIGYVFIDWRHLPELLDAGRDAFTELKQLCVWNKSNAGMGTFYRSQHELVMVWKVGTSPHTNTFGLGENGRHRTNVWSYAGANAFGSGRLEELAMHPTVKPVAMLADAIKDVTHRGQIVLDVFGGSGSTLVAAERTGRRARIIEIDPIYCDTIVTRWQELTGKVATLVAGGATFERIREMREGWAEPVTTGHAA